jgi:chemosensory pili system protein ChpA (sensor histidine kinase/response regulator)
MATHIDVKMLAGFAQEVQPTLSKMQHGIAQFLQDPRQRDALEDAYQCMQTMKDAAEMLRLPVLRHLALSLEEMVEDVATSSTTPSAPQSFWLQRATMHFENYLQRLLAGAEQEAASAAALVQAYRRFKQLPEADDKAVVTALLGEEIEMPPPESLPPSPPKPMPQAPVSVMPPSAQGPDDASDELIEGFLMEAEDYLNTIGRTLPEVEKAADQRECLQRVRRSVHTFKGAAGVVGFRSASQLAHRMEDLLDELYAESRPYTAKVKDVLFATFDALDEFIRTKGQMPTFDQVSARLQGVYATVWDEAPADVAPPVTAVLTAAAAPAIQAPPVPVAATEEVPESAVAAVTQLADVLRVPLHRVDELVRLISELVISRSAYEQHLGRLTHQVDELRLSMERLQRTTTTIETQYEVRALADSPGFLSAPLAGSRTSARAATSVGSSQEFDALEFDQYSEFTLVARELSETTADISALGQEFKDVVSDFEGYLTRQSRLTSEIQDKLMRLRMVPLATMATRLHRAVRVTARERAKEAVLVLEGEHVEFDKTMLEDMAEPLLHLLRNAVDHGIEAPDVREQLGKSRQGTIHLHAFREGTQVVVQMRDDGAGLHPQKLRAAVVKGGFCTEEEAAQLTDEQLYSFIFKPGFSTASEVNEVSGRGLGMDIVQSIVSRLKGHVTIQSTPGQGVTFTMRLPLTMAITRVLMVKAYGETLALPLADVAQVMRIEPTAIEQVGGAPVIRLGEQILPVVRLGEQLHLPQPTDSTARVLPVVVVQTGETQVAFIVDELLGGREVVVKTLGSHLRRVHGVIGSTLMGDGSVVLILNPVELVRDARQQAAQARTAAVKARTPRAHEALEILIVDDSFSVRRVVANLIKSAGWLPILAKDGLEALHIIQHATTLPDLILLDVEMPQMDGYELTSTLRSQAAYRDLPIVMLTSRSGEKHRRKAFEVGATDYLVKPYQDDLLLSTVRRLVPQGHGVSAA